MIPFHYSSLAGALFAVGMLAAQSVSAASLPGGASSLVETYDDWGVVCQIQNNAPACVVRQVQTNNQTNQAVLTAEIGKAADGKFQGVLLLPLGLALAPGAQLKVDDNSIGSPLPFSTCVPQGCLVPLVLEADTITKLRAGKALNVTVSAINPSKPVTFAVSLKGFSGALNRVAELTK
ncbi:invasion associated locus B family protein [Rhizobium miluonense]|uniref:Invasion protein IalB, involved in pathogenesis n=1 Tax=Rhizobium miluonense TaxID=411945 RepID=A0A1C3UZJ7_9HYPH|nr:invasion associated locus B family protein [Rhizobium miluonense]SCB20828.1 Invasion protein IalB, involved in pathogenesis [Rhizobium miluonense]